MPDLPETTFTNKDLVLMVKTMAGLAALGGTSRQVCAAEIGRRVDIQEVDAQAALTNLETMNYVILHTNSTTHYRIHA